MPIDWAGVFSANKVVMATLKGIKALIDITVKNPPVLLEEPLKKLEDTIDKGKKYYKINKQVSKVINRIREKESIYNLFEAARSGVLTIKENSIWLYGEKGVGKSYLFRFIKEVNDDFKYDVFLLNIDDANNFQEEVFEKVFKTPYHTINNFSSSSQAQKLIAMKWVSHFSKAINPGIVLIDLNFPYDKSVDVENFLLEVFKNDEKQSSDFNYGVIVLSGCSPQSQKIVNRPILPLDKKHCKQLAARYLKKTKKKFTQKDLEIIAAKSKGLPSLIRAFSLTHEKDKFLIALEKHTGEMTTLHKHIFWCIACFYNNKMLRKDTENKMIGLEVIKELVSFFCSNLKLDTQRIEAALSDIQERGLYYTYNDQIYVNQEMVDSIVLAIPNCKYSVINKKIFEWLNTLSDVKKPLYSPLLTWYLLETNNASYVINNLEKLHSILIGDEEIARKFLRQLIDVIDHSISDIESEIQTNIDSQKSYIISLLITEFKSTLSEKHLLFAFKVLQSICVSLANQSLHWKPETLRTESILFNAGNISIVLHQYAYKLTRGSNSEASLDFLDLAEKYYQQALGAWSGDNIKLKINIYRMLSYVNIMHPVISKEQLKEATLNIEKAFSIYYSNVESEDFNLLGNLLSTEAGVFEELAHINDDNLNFFNLSLDKYIRAFEKINQTDIQRHKGIALHNIGNLHAKIAITMQKRSTGTQDSIGILNNLKFAEKYYTDALTYRPKQTFPLDYIDTSLSLCDIKYKQIQFLKIESNQTLSILKKNLNVLYEILELNILFSENEVNNLNIYRLIRYYTMTYAGLELDHKESLGYLEKSIELSEFSLDFVNGYFLFLQLNNLGVMYGLMGDILKNKNMYESAIHSFKEAIELLKNDVVYGPEYARAEGLNYDGEILNYLNNLAISHNLSNVGDCFLKKSEVSDNIYMKRIELDQALVVYSDALLYLDKILNSRYAALTIDGQNFTRDNLEYRIKKAKEILNSLQHE